jgi:hypothetical protein
MKVVSDVLHLSYLDKFGLRVTVEAGQALACLYSIVKRGYIRDQSLRWDRCWKILEKTEKVKVGRNNKMATVGSPSTGCSLIAFLHPLTRPKLLFARWPARAQTRRDDDSSPNQKGGQITSAWSYSKIAAILPLKRYGRSQCLIK